MLILLIWFNGRLNDVEQYAGKPMVRDPHIRNSKLALLNWNRRYVQWRQENWAWVFFSDKNRYRLNTDSKRVSIWRQTCFEIRLNLRSFIRIISSFLSCLMVFVRIMTNGFFERHFPYVAIVTTDCYLYEVLQPQTVYVSYSPRDFYNEWQCWPT